MGFKKDFSTLPDILGAAMPSGVARRMPPAGLARVWRQVVGEAIARHSRPICLDRDGSLVVAVQGSIWRQELSLSGPQILEKLGQAGFDFAGLKFIAARTPQSAPPPPQLPQLSQAEEERILSLVEKVKDSKLRQALASLMRAEMRARKASDK